jgi:hypothetical protein
MANGWKQKGRDGWALFRYRFVEGGHTNPKACSSFFTLAVVFELGGFGEARYFIEFRPTGSFGIDLIASFFERGQIIIVDHGVRSTRWCWQQQHGWFLEWGALGRRIHFGLARARFSGSFFGSPLGRPDF